MATSIDLDSLNKEIDQLHAGLVQASSKDEALRTAFSAAELSMKALKMIKDPVAKTAMSAKFELLLQEIERLKHSDPWSAALVDVDVTQIKTLEEPLSTRTLPKSEEILLLKASFLNGFKFPPWKGPPQDSEFELQEGEQLFQDVRDLSLSALQLKVFDQWKRPKDALPPPSWSTSDLLTPNASMAASQKIDLVQDAATDCSVVASLCAGIARGERGHRRILRSILYPYDSASGRPKMSKNGKYVVRLNVNGTYRRVEIDDRLPASKTSRVLHVIDRQNPGLLWPALLEKAYLKVRGSYDFPGSNSGTDLWILTGWIPEQIFLQSDDTLPNLVWRRVFAAHRYGDVLVTMGTGKMSTQAEKEIGLAGEHDYAVLDLREVDGQKLLLVKNPWCEGTSWKGSMPKVKSAREISQKHSHTNEDDEDDHTMTSSRDLLNSNDQLKPGTFWMDLNSVVQHFESIYLNWNPGLFRYRQDMHFSWDLSAKGQTAVHRGKHRSFSSHPQFCITVNKGEAAWVLLCRHFRDAEPKAQASSQNRLADESQLSGYISMYAFETGGSRVFLSDDVLLRGPFVDSPQTLLRLDDIQPRKRYTIVPVEQDLPDALHTFTISVFAHSPVSIHNADHKYPHQRTACAAWVEGTAGGNANSPSYSQNPQFSLAVAHRSSISLLLETPVERLNVHVKLVHGRGQRVQTLRSRDIIFDSKDYRRGCALAEFTDLDAGTYTIICSTFEAGEMGDFSLRVDSTTPVQLALLPREGAGRLRIKLADAMFHGQQYKLAAPLVPQRLSKLMMLATHSSNGVVAYTARAQHRERSMIRITIELGRGPERQILIASADGEYSDAIAGVRTDEIDVSPQITGRSHMWLVVERMSTPRDLPEEVFKVDMFTDTPDALAVGVWRRIDD